MRPLRIDESKWNTFDAWIGKELYTRIY
jgi:hypothetical protein